MESLINKFYTAFKNLDAETMSSCYHKDIAFYDPGFGDLNGVHATNMWRMLCKSQKDKGFKLSFSNIEANDNKGSAKWEAKYTFSKTGRKVHNKISAQFEFKEGLIIKHIDTFNLHKWATQAMGIKGLVMGRTAYFKYKLQKQTKALLIKFEANL